VTPLCLIPVRCPHCGTSFVIDPATETASITEGTEGADGDDGGDAPVAFRPICPRCQRRVAVRLANPIHDYRRAM
jgi:hypothetical protein